ncbi:unnamed protein product [Paramecium octaurelia]|uniref:Uncharacterized protein n=1 Tax=Paramecium octaurelia TaxID=43137 RepID=A0A8S1TQV3_PAROT|nr:unnamed protein product [Paramecium octaurelia]
MQQKCCCLPTQKAFLMIVYLDISRIIWGTVACAFMFQKDSSLSLIISIMDIIIIVFQSSVALYINMRALKQQNKKPIFIYRKLKVLSICFNILDRLIVPIINCTLIFKDDQKEARSQYCVLDIFVALIITAIIWNLIEYYFYTIVRDFVLILQSTQNRSLRYINDSKLKLLEQQNLAIVFEVVGLRPALRRGGQPVINSDRVEQGHLKNTSEVQKIYQQPLQHNQSFQVYGSQKELIEINLIE